MKVRYLTEEEIKQILEQTWHGVLALVDEDKPYCFPTAHVYYRGGIYFLFLKYGRKVRCIEKNPRACYLVHEVSPHRWFSILVEGRLVKVSDSLELRSVLDLFYSRVFQVDPYFAELRSDRSVIDRLLDQIARSNIPGVYKLDVEKLSGIASI